METFRLLADSGQVFEIAADQRGHDVKMTLRGPDGEVLQEVDGRYGAIGVERVFWIAEEAGRYLLEIQILEGPSADGCYVLDVAARRSAMDEDRRRFAAADAFLAAKRDSGEKRRESLRSTARRWRELGSGPRQADALSLLARVLEHEQEPVAALAVLQEILEIEELDPAQRAITLYELGNLELAKRRDLERSLEILEMAGELAESMLGAESLEARIAAALGRVYTRFGEVARALESYRRAATLAAEIGRPTIEALALLGHGTLELRLSRPKRAENDLGRALELAESRGDEKLVAVIATQLADAHVARKRFDAAFLRLRQALRLRRDDPQYLPLTQLVQGWAEHKAWQAGERHDPETAYAVYQQALEGVRAHGGAGEFEADVLHRIALLELDWDRLDAATERFEQAVAGYRKAGHLDGESEALYGLALCRRERGDVDGALGEVEAAMEIVEQMSRLPQSSEVRSVYLAAKQHIVDLQIELLMALDTERPGAGYAARALAASEVGRARALLENLGASGVDPFRRGEDGRLAEVDTLRRRIVSKLYRSQFVSAAEAAVLRQDAERLTPAYARLERLLVGNLSRAALLGYGWSGSVETLQADGLDPETVLIEIHLTQEHGFLWRVTSESVRGLTLQASSMEITRRAREIHRLFQGNLRRDEFRVLQKALQELSDLLLAPIAADLAGRRLVIVPDGPLHYVPFAALPLPGASPPAHGWPEPLVAGHELVVLPSGSTLVALRGLEQSMKGSGSTMRGFVLGDPVFECDDPRLTERGERCDTTGGVPWERVPHTGTEAARIRELDPDAWVVTGAQARKDLVDRPMFRNADYVHLATHGEYNDQYPERSSLVFSLFDEQGEPLQGYLTMREVFEDLYLSAELVVLSACETILGEQVHGEGLVGLTRGMLYAGAARVMASLWAVQDDSTAELMVRFYDALHREKMRPAAALRAAQLAMARSEKLHWRSPYHWAGFQIQGLF